MNQRQLQALGVLVGGSVAIIALQRAVKQSGAVLNLDPIALTVMLGAASWLYDAMWKPDGR